MIRTCVFALFALLAACGEPQSSGAARAESHAVLNVDDSVTDVEAYLRALPESEQVAAGLIQHMRRANGTATVEADLLDAQSGAPVGLARYELADENGRTRITLRLSGMSGYYADAGRQAVLRGQILEYLRRDLGDV